ncbi:MAG: folylpolyglutamate synthase/dihydrofolate synthase family protein [Eubacteriales bacterium]|nr:bifunctional folylpolyglutamate synthase/dihydrofolate synthase [Lachnospiraceae bacterium]MDO5127375.1 folylpolyglutamate synthase/dihydrofolate synthase family protein [Eubacteriales bacterium]
MNFKNAMQYINRKNKLGTMPGLDTITELLKRLGNPQDACRCLHIAGTNGKGSVFSYVQEILMEAGYKVGRYVSPTILDYLERFQIDRCNMDEDTFSRLLTRVSDCCEVMEAETAYCPTSFEIETAIAFLYFKEQHADYALIECGMGGLLDATNVIRHPVCCVFASISMDHISYLGDTLEKIAAQKAGIIKENSLCISAPQQPEVLHVLEDTCRMRHSKLCCADAGQLTIIQMNLERSIFEYENEQYEITLLGEHQLQNAITAIEVANRIPNVTIEHIKNGLRKTKWVGRMTKVREQPLMYVDGAHNEAAWKYLRKMVNKYFTNRRIIYIIGVLKDKAYDCMVELLADTMDYAVVITPPTPRGLDKDILASSLSANGVSCCTAENHRQAIMLANSQAKLFADTENNRPDPVILVCGSLSFLSEYLTDID